MGTSHGARCAAAAAALFCTAATSRACCSPTLCARLLLVCSLRRVSTRLRRVKRSQRRTASRSEATLLRDERVVLRSALVEQRSAAPVHDPTHVYRRRRSITRAPSPKRRITTWFSATRRPQTPPHPERFAASRRGALTLLRARFPILPPESAQPLSVFQDLRACCAARLVDAFEQSCVAASSCDPIGTGRSRLEACLLCELHVSTLQFERVRTATRRRERPSPDASRLVTSCTSRSSLPQFAESLRVLTSRHERQRTKRRPTLASRSAARRASAAVRSRTPIATRRPNGGQ